MARKVSAMKAGRGSKAEERRKANAKEPKEQPGTGPLPTTRLEARWANAADGR